MKKVITITTIAILATCSWEIQAQQSPFMERLAFYYNDTTLNFSQMFVQIANDNIIRNQGNYPELIRYLGSPDSLYKNTMVSYILIFHLNQYRKVEYLTNKEKNEILLFISNIFLVDKISQYNISEDLFNTGLWDKNDSIQYNTLLISNLQYLIKNKPTLILPRAGRFFYETHIDFLLTDILKYIIKPAFVDSVYTGLTNDTIWDHLYFLAIAQNEEVLPYLYKALQESSCSDDYAFEKQQDICTLLNKIQDDKIKKQIFLNVLQDDCLTTLFTPTITRNERSISHFEHTILLKLKKYPNFPMEEVKKLSVPQQVEFVRNWINENL